ncbi:MAG: phosphatase PAP2 family protein [Thermoplasmatota archaeon]
MIVQQKISLAIILFVTIIHLFQVNIIHPYVSTLIDIDFAPLMSTLDFGIGLMIPQYWNPILVYFFVFMYIIVYPFTLWFTILYFILYNDVKFLKIFSYGLGLIYVCSLPFYLFFPVTNVYTYYTHPSALELVIPSIDTFYYSTTTTNNCFPSLHVAVSLLIALSLSQGVHKKYKYFCYFCAICVILSVIYLAIHWIIDVIAGIILAVGGFYLVKYMSEK